MLEVRNSRKLSVEAFGDLHHAPTVRATPHQRVKEKSIGNYAVERIYCFTSFESLKNLVRLFKRVSKSRETFKVRDFVNSSTNLTIDHY